MPKKKFYVILKQRDNGCDYTIECGTRVILIEVPNDWHRKRVSLEVTASLVFDEDGDEPEPKLNRQIAPYLSPRYNGNQPIAEVHIVPAEGTTTLDVQSIITQVQRQRKATADEAAKEERRLQYEALKKEFEKK